MITVRWHAVFRKKFRISDFFQSKHRAPQFQERETEQSPPNLLELLFAELVPLFFQLTNDTHMLFFRQCDLDTIEDTAENDA